MSGPAAPGGWSPDVGSAGRGTAALATAGRLDPVAAGRRGGGPAAARPAGRGGLARVPGAGSYSGGSGGRRSGRRGSRDNRRERRIGRDGGEGPLRGPHIGASDAALTDIPPDYLAEYVTAARTCPALTWQVLAAIGKIESDHGRSSAPGVKSGVNRFGCCAGPMQFNLMNGPPSTWDTWGTGVRAHVYDPAHAIPAAARKLCADGLARPEAVGRDPCPQVHGSAALHTALRRYNNACWYVHEVVTLAGRYTRAAPARCRPATRSSAPW